MLTLAAPETMASGRAGWGTGVGTGAAGWMVAWQWGASWSTWSPPTTDLGSVTYTVHVECPAAPGCPDEADVTLTLIECLLDVEFGALEATWDTTVDPAVSSRYAWAGISRQVEKGRPSTIEEHNLVIHPTGPSRRVCFQTKPASLSPKLEADSTGQIVVHSVKIIKYTFYNLKPV